jgi:oxygen-independent coproporphyrinogen-3 oxidase
MKTTARRDLLLWAENELTALGLEGFVKSGAIERVRSGLGGSHTVVTYPPLDSLEEVDPQQLLERIGPVRGLSLYLHVAFCEFLCPFCHYETEFTKLGAEEPPRMRAYMDALEKELAYWKSVIDGSGLGSIYIGGGTPTAVSEERLLRLLSTAISTPDTNEGRRAVCMETSPLTTVAEDGEKKLRALVSAGVNRLSIGVQSFNSQLLRRTRGYTQIEAVRALEIISGVLDNVNVDMIQDLPFQTSEHILDDLEQIERFRPAQVTWYILRIRPEASWYGRFRRESLELPNTLESARRTLLIREGMARLGYIKQPGGRFVREEKFHDRFKQIRAGLETTLLGLGASAYSHGWGYIFRNAYTRGQDVNGMREYIKLINDRGHAIVAARALNDVEVAAGKLVTGIRGGVHLPPSTAQTAAYLAGAARTMDELCGLGLVAFDLARGYGLTTLGSLFEEEVCALFYSPAVKTKLTEDHAAAPGGLPYARGAVSVTQ